MIKNKKEKTILMYGALTFCQIFNLLMSNVDSFLFVRCVSKPYCKLNKVQKALFYNFS